jgi:hypothetical protein
MASVDGASTEDTSPVDGDWSTMEEGFAADEDYQPEPPPRPRQQPGSAVSHPGLTPTIHSVCIAVFNQPPSAKNAEEGSRGVTDGSQRALNVPVPACSVCFGGPARREAPRRAISEHFEAK